MSAPQQPQQEPVQQTTSPEVWNQQLDAAKILASKAAGSTSAAEAKDFAQGSLLLTQAAVVLDPALSQGGTPIAHDLALENARQAGQVAVAKVQSDTAIQQERIRGEHTVKAAAEQAKGVAAAPTPAKTNIAQPPGKQQGPPKPGKP